jgi:hypothetical protein
MNETKKLHRKLTENCYGKDLHMIFSCKWDNFETDAWIVEI